jgi:hypothetical protein
MAAAVATAMANIATAIAGIMTAAHHRTDEGDGNERHQLTHGLASYLGATTARLHHLVDDAGR